MTAMMMTSKAKIIGWGEKEQREEQKEAEEQEGEQEQEVVEDACDHEMLP